MLREIIENGFVQQVVKNLKYINSMISFVKRENSTGKWERAREDNIVFHNETDEEMGIYLPDSPLIVALNKILGSKKQVE
jgi:hypothetical protein